MRQFVIFLEPTELGRIIDAIPVQDWISRQVLTTSREFTQKELGVQERMCLKLCTIDTNLPYSFINSALAIYSYVNHCQGQK